MKECLYKFLLDSWTLEEAVYVRSGSRLNAMAMFLKILDDNDIDYSTSTIICMVVSLDD